MQIDSLTEVLGAVLTYTDLQAEQIGSDEHNPIPQLMVHLSPHLSLRIFCANDAFSQTDLQGEVSSVYYFVVRYPETIAPELWGEVRRLLDVFNYLLPIGMLELHSQDGIFFRHMLLTEESVLDGLLALDIILALKFLLPHVFTWLQRVLMQPQAISPELQQEIKQEFRRILKLLPAMEPVLSSSLPARPQRANVFKPTIPATLAGTGATLLLSSILVPGLQGLALLGGLCTLMAYVFRRRYLKQLTGRKDQLELRFFWQLLEVEAVKLAYQDHSLDQHRQSVLQKLNELGGFSVTYPSDVLRLRTQMRSLRELQAHLSHRSQVLKEKRQELDKNRTQLQTQRRELLPELRAFSPPAALELEETGCASEDMLMQNLVVTLDYLDFPVRVLSGLPSHSPVVLVYLRPELPPMVVRWLRQWHQAPDSPSHSWMLCFDLALGVRIPPESWGRVQELLRMFNRFLPLGSLICDHSHQRVILRYRFVRMRGDLSTMLVMEILEVMASFAERLQRRLHECLDENKHLDRILHETELDFQTLQT